MTTLAATIVLSVVWGLIHALEDWSANRDGRRAAVFFAASGIIGFGAACLAAYAWRSFIDPSAPFYAVANFFLVIGIAIRVIRRLIEALLARLSG